MTRFPRSTILPQLSFLAFALSLVMTPSQVLGDGLDGTELARAKFAWAQVDPQELARARLEAARGQFEARRQEFLAGRGTLWVLREALQNLLESQLALSVTEANRVATLEGHWERTREIAEANRIRYEAGRAPLKELAEARYDHLEAEIHLSRALAQGGPAATLVGGGLVRNDPLNSEELARAKFEATQADPRVLAQDKLRVAQIAYEFRKRTFLVGHAGPYLTLDASRRWAEAALVVRENAADEVAIFERHWEVSWLGEAAAHARYESWGYPAQVWDHARYSRLEAQLAWSRARHLQSRSGASGGDLMALGIWANPLDAVELAQAKAVAVQAIPEELTRAQLEAIRQVYKAQKIEFLHGWGTLDFLLEVARDELKAERAVATTDAERRAALERYWSRLLEIEAVQIGRFEAGRIPIQDLLQARYYRLDAAIQLRAASPR